MENPKVSLRISNGLNKKRSETSLLLYILFSFTKSRNPEKSITHTPSMLESSSSNTLGVPITGAVFFSLFVVFSAGSSIPNTSAQTFSLAVFIAVSFLFFSLTCKGTKKLRYNQLFSIFFHSISINHSDNISGLKKDCSKIHS